MKPKCPDCNHPVDEHADFFCMHINCYCNNGKRTATALYERELYKNLYEELKAKVESSLSLSSLPEPSGVATHRSLSEG